VIRVRDAVVEYTYIASRLIKEVASFGTSVAGMVPPGVEKRLIERFPLKA
jgi:phosphopantetheine adenylyltransferase